MRTMLRGPLALAVMSGISLAADMPPNMLEIDELTVDTLSADDVCRTGDEACSANLLQHRAQQKAVADTVVGSNLTLPWGHPDKSATYPKYDEFTLWLVEEFEHPLDLNKDPIWTWSDGGLGEGDVRFVKDNIVFEKGLMKLVVNQYHPGTKLQSCSHAEVGRIDNKPLLSGEMRTRNNLFRYGRYEARLRTPEVKPGNPNINGNYISTFFVFRAGKFKHWREIDFEIMGDDPKHVATNYLYGEKVDRWYPHIEKPGQSYIAGNTRRDFHIYAFEWLPDRITWYVDGVKIREALSGSLPIPEMSVKIMMNLWIFSAGATGGAEKWNNEYPMYAEYDWVRFYKWNGDKQYPPACMSEACLPPDDLYLASNNPCDGIPMPPGVVDGRATCQGDRRAC